MFCRTEVVLKRPYFFFGEKVVALFDVPHLLKCTRNNFYKNVIHVPMEINGHKFLFPAQWQHTRDAVKLGKTLKSLLQKFGKDNSQASGSKKARCNEGFLGCPDF
ncbi:hypothetical protein J437_LFUL018727 [Ladona fulva]|uniref:Transposase n=1 Tax=Ladona fulva TaxID=123851 RepID=A0A8K0KPB6_LADFU|nr:hypothetical protein J437_LFUL018727 [Ladona fulva]